MATKRTLRPVALLLTLALLLGLLAGCASAPEAPAVQETAVWTPPSGERVEAREDYVVVAESDTYRLWYYEPQFSIKLENKETGVVMESTLSEEKDNGRNNKSWTGYMKSGIVLSAIIGTINTYQVDMNTVENTIETYYIDHGICANIFFGDKFQFGLAVEVTLEDDQLVVRVPNESIVETKENTYISTVSLFPFMGYSHLGEDEGYMLIPDGNGALIYLNDKEGRYSTGFSRLIYGVDEGFVQNKVTSYLWGRFETVTAANNVMAPVFGMAHTDDQMAYLAIVESGDERCSVECHPNGVMVDYDRCFAKFLLRDIFVQPLNNSNSGTVTAVESNRLRSDLCVRYCLLSGEEANYSGMANAYRAYLLNNGMVTAQDCGYNTRLDVLGSECEEFLMGTTDVPMTTVDDVQTMFDDLRSQGVDSVLCVYRGWQNGGLYSLPISKYKADSAIGGTSALTNLVEKQAELGYNVYLYNDALLVNDATSAFTFDVMKRVNKRTYQLSTRDQVYDLFYYLMPSKTDAYLQRFVKDCADKGVNNIALAGISDTLFSYSSKGAYYSRTDTMADYIATIQAIQGGSLAMEAPNAYLWKYADVYLDMPMGSSDYLYVDQEVPFMSMVLKGILPMYSKYVNFEANKTENFLQMVESGVYPSFYLTWENASKLIYTNSNDLYSLEYESYKNTVVEYDAALRALAEKTANAHILRHERLADGVVKVSYDNGVTVYVNYTQRDYTGDGTTVAALSYKVGE